MGRQLRNVRIVTMVLVLCTALTAPAEACPVCFGAADSPQFFGMQMAILALLGITVGVLGAFAAFFICLMRRARLTASNAMPVEATGAYGGNS